MGVLKLSQERVGGVTDKNLSLSVCNFRFLTFSRFDKWKKGNLPLLLAKKSPPLRLRCRSGGRPPPQRLTPCSNSMLNLLEWGETVVGCITGAGGERKKGEERRRVPHLYGGGGDLACHEMQQPLLPLLLPFVGGRPSVTEDWGEGEKLTLRCDTKWSTFCFLPKLPKLKKIGRNSSCCYVRILTEAPCTHVQTVRNEKKKDFSSCMLASNVACLPLPLFGIF